jgi:hypothetical protein
LTIALRAAAFYPACGCVATFPDVSHEAQYGASQATNSAVLPPTRSAHGQQAMLSIYGNFPFWQKKKEYGAKKG